MTTLFLAVNVVVLVGLIAVLVTRVVQRRRAAKRLEAQQAFESFQQTYGEPEIVGPVDLAHQTPTLFALGSDGDDEIGVLFDPPAEKRKKKGKGKKKGKKSKKKA